MALLQIILYLPPVIEINKAKKSCVTVIREKKTGGGGGGNIFFEEEEVSRQKHRKCSLIYDNGTQMVNLHEIMARLLIE